MTAAELATLIAAATPGVVALARLVRQGDQVRKVEASRRDQGERIGDVRTELDVLRGRVEELSRSVHAGAPPPFRPMGAPVDRSHLLPRRETPR